MSHSSFDRNTFLIYQFLINLWNVIINRIRFNLNKKKKSKLELYEDHRSEGASTGSWSIVSSYLSRTWRIEYEYMK